PHLLAFFQRQAMQDALGAERDDVVAGDHRRGARAMHAGLAIDEFGGIREFPHRLAIAGGNAFDDLVVANAVEDDRAIAGHDHAAKAVANFALPDDFRTSFG